VSLAATTALTALMAAPCAFLIARSALPACNGTVATGPATGMLAWIVY
jgi:hypothetical protein